MATVAEIAEEIRQHIDVMAHPTITKSVFNDVSALDDVMAEDEVHISGKEAASIRVSFGGGEIYDLYVVKV